MKQTLLLWSGDSFALNISALVFQTGVVFFFGGQGFMLVMVWLKIQVRRN
jgi:PleD family two-component response regulator